MPRPHVAPGLPMSVLVKLALGAVALYLAVVALLFAVQRRLIYYPTPTPVAPEMLAARGLEPWGEHLVRRAEAPVGVAVVFHGNAGAAADRGYFADALAARGLTAVLVEYPGYAGRPGTPSEDALVADGAAVVTAAREAFGGPVTVWGESLGAGVAAAVVARAGGAVEAVILVTPWATLPDLSAEFYPWVPVRMLLRDRYDSLSHLRSFEGRVGVLIAGRDEVIPPHHAERLVAGLPGPVAVWRFPAAGHNSWPAGPDETWWDEAVAVALDAPERLSDAARVEAQP